MKAKERTRYEYFSCWFGFNGKEKDSSVKKDVSAISHLWSGSECTAMCVCKERVRNGDISDEWKKLISQRKFECAFVCTSPLTHAGIIKTCLENDMNVFTELILFQMVMWTISFGKTKEQASLFIVYYDL